MYVVKCCELKPHRTAQYTCFYGHVSVFLFLSFFLTSQPIMAVQPMPHAAVT